MGKPLVIVESPAKAKTIGKFLGNDYVVEACVGHIRDLPQGADQVPAKYKGLPWARHGVDVENDFSPLYVLTPRGKDSIKTLKGFLKDAPALYVATDEDREGEAIAWHEKEVLEQKNLLKDKKLKELYSMKLLKKLSKKVLRIQEILRLN